MGSYREDRGRGGDGSTSDARGGPYKLLIVTDSLEVGGAERHVVDLVLALRREGHAVTVACSVSGSLAEPLEAARIPVRSLVRRKIKRRVSLPYAWALRKLLERERFDLVHAHVYSSAAASALATVGTDVPLVVTEHTEAPWQGRGGRLFSRWMYRRVSRVIAVSSAIERRLIERDRVPPGRISVVPNSVPPTWEAQGEVLPLPQELVSGEGPVVGMVARLQPEKGVKSFLEAASRVAEEFPAARFVVVGDGPLRRELFGLAERLGIREHVVFTGFRPDAQALIRLMGVVAVPSVSEGTPLVVLEAMAAGVPVVASRVGGIPDQIEHGREGFLIPPGDTQALGEAILELLRNPELARRMGEAGSLRAGTEFGHENMVRAIEEIYRDVLAGSKSTERGL